MNQNWSYKDSCFVINNLNGIKKHVKDISVDAVLGCEFRSVIVIYDTNYSTNNYIILTAVSSLITTITVEISTEFFNHSFTAHHLSHHVNSATKSIGRQTGMW